MIELIKKEIHMNRQRGTAVSQLTLDDDFIVPDALDDASCAKRLAESALASLISGWMMRCRYCC